MYEHWSFITDSYSTVKGNPLNLTKVYWIRLADCMFNVDDNRLGVFFRPVTVPAENPTCHFGLQQILQLGLLVQCLGRQLGGGREAYQDHTDVVQTPLGGRRRKESEHGGEENLSRGHKSQTMDESDPDVVQTVLKKTRKSQTSKSKK